MAALMIRRIAMLLLMVLTTGLLAHTSLAAGSTPPGYYLRWDQCYTDGGAVNKTFACDTNAGASTLVLSFELDQTSTDVNGLEIVIDIATPEVSIPAWWQFKNTGTCRISSLTMLPQSPAGAVNCVDWAAGQASGGFGGYSVVTTQLTTARMRASFATAVLPTAMATLTPGHEYVACLLQIDHHKTVGTNSCSGCSAPACIHAEKIKFTHPNPAVDFTLTQDADGPGTGRVTWQDGAFANLGRTCGQLGCFTDFTCTSVTPTHLSTWGAVKALYR